MGARFGKFGVPGDGGSADRLTVTFGLKSLAWTPTMLGFCAVLTRTAPSAGSSLWMRLRDRSSVEVVAGLTAVVVVAGLVVVVVAGLIAVAVTGLTVVVVAGLAATDVVAGLLAVVVAGARTTGAGAGAARTTGAGAARTTGAGARTTGAGAGAARTTGAGADVVVVLFLVSAQADDGNATADIRPTSIISLWNFMTLPPRNVDKKR